jgi:hypothetical protein
MLNLPSSFHLMPRGLSGNGLSRANAIITELKELT